MDAAMQRQGRGQHPRLVRLPGCGTTCTDSGAWHKKGDDEKDCAWVASHPSESRCMVRGEDDTLAKDACPSACAPQ